MDEKLRGKVRAKIKYHSGFGLAEESADDVIQAIEPLIRQDERKKTMQYVVYRLREVDDLSLDKPDFVRRACNLIVEFEQALKATVEGK